MRNFKSNRSIFLCPLISFIFGSMVLRNSALLAHKFVFALIPAVTRLVTDRIVTNSSAADGWMPTYQIEIFFSYRWMDAHDSRLIYFLVNIYIYIY